MNGSSAPHLPRLLPLLRLLRVGTLFSPAADVVASWAMAGLPWDSRAAGAAGASVAVYAGGMVWNDIADRHEDSRQRPERPLVRGEVSLPFAVALGGVLLLLAVLLSPVPAHHAWLAGLVLLYDFVLKRLGWLAALGMASLRAMNLGTALATGLVPDPVVPALFAAAAAYAAYIAAVTVLGIFEDLPNVRPRAVAAVVAAPPMALLVGAWAVQGGPWPAPALAVLPILWFARGNTRQQRWDRPAIRRVMTWLLVGTMLYTALLALAAAQPWAALGIASAIAPARWIARRIALT